MHRRDRALLDNPGKGPALFVVELRLLARCLAVDQSVRPLRVETQNPVPDHLQADSPDTGRVRPSPAIVNLRQCQ